MNNSILSGKWKEIKGEVMKTWGELTADEVDRTQGNAKSLIGLLEQKFGMAKDEASKKINDLIGRYHREGDAKVDTLSDKVNTKIDHAKDALKDKSAKTGRH
jgi:uncharacterized protein YjbJ (UPF0337 family)